jgi:glycyl-tRNA synthetase beta chain
MPHFLFELGLEEVPARMIAGAQAELLKRTLALLTREQLIAADPVAQSFSTPRRLAVLIHDVKAQQDDITEEVTGPALKIAFKDGLPTPAAEAFARKAGVSVEDLRTISTPKGDYLAATSIKKGRSAAAVIAEELPKEIAGIYWAKNMYWLSPTGQKTSGGDPVRPGKPEKFVRPVLWLVCLLGDTIVPVTFAGKTADRASFGHRVLSSGEAFDIVTPESYLAQLEGEYVLGDVELRRHKIRKALDKVTREVPNARWREDEALVDAVTHLTEWPDVLLGSFEPDYLELPEEVLVTVMRDHQKYFAVEISNNAGAPYLDSEMWAGKNPLAPHFLTVTNIALDETNAPIIKQGNERVLRARFNDAKFFWQFDQKIPLTDRVPMLEKVMFQKDLGSYAAKTDRVVKLCRIFAEFAQMRKVDIDFNALTDAAGLAKTDLTTELVKEFTELQGIIGGLYFKDEAKRNPDERMSKARTEITWQAIYDQYLPASAQDPIPRSPEGCILGLADRIDTIYGMFSLGMEPTGSKDPFALRRAANSIVRILAESSLPLKLSDVVRAVDPKPEVATKLTAFFAERIDFYLREARDQAYDVVKAVMAAGSDDIADLVARAEAVTAVRGSEDFLAVSAAFKRMKNILAQAAEKGEAIGGKSASDPHPAFQALHSAATEVSGEFANDAAAGEYGRALERLATLRPQIDSFFDQVMVMDPDLTIRAARLGLLAEMVQTFSTLADFSEIVVAG